MYLLKKRDLLGVKNVTLVKPLSKVVAAVSDGLWILGVVSPVLNTQVINPVGVLGLVGSGALKASQMLWFTVLVTSSDVVENGVLTPNPPMSDAASLARVLGYSA